MGYILLEGGAEFSGHMALADRRAIALAGGENASVAIVPAAAAPDNNHVRAGSRGADWFRRLGARNAVVLGLIDQKSAQDTALATALKNFRLVFLLGGFPGYLADTLSNSVSWIAITQVEQSGGIVAGSSAGAMVLCEHFYDPGIQKVRAGLNLIPNTCLVPHHDTYGGRWIDAIKKRIPDAVILGIDEETGMINDGENRAWQVYGKGAVTLYRKNGVHLFHLKQSFQLN
jgi:cyanophycinase